MGDPCSIRIGTIFEAFGLAQMSAIHKDMLGTNIMTHTDCAITTLDRQKVFKISMTGFPSMVSSGVNAPVVRDSFVAGALELATDALRLFGPAHWMWKMGLLFAVDLDLSYIEYSAGYHALRKTVEYR